MDRCPHCHMALRPGDAERGRCSFCDHSLINEDPSDQGLQGQESYYSMKTAKWHIADNYVVPQSQPDLPGGGDFGDHSRVDQMSTDQMSGHQNEVNYAVQEINKATTQGQVIDESFLRQLKENISVKFGIDPAEAETVVDAAVAQPQNQDETLDQVPPHSPADQVDPSVEQAGPGEVINGGAFAHVMTPSGRVGHVIERWEDIYGEKWAMVATSEGYRENVYEDELRTTEQSDTLSDPVREIEAFIDSMEPVNQTVASVKARIANLRMIRQDVRRHMKNQRLSFNQKLALDKIDQEAQLGLLDLTQSAVLRATDQEQKYIERNTKKYATDVIDMDLQPTMFGVSDLQIDENPPAYTNEDLEYGVEEEAAVFVTDKSDALLDGPHLEDAASRHMDTLTMGHPEEVRAHHRARFTEAVKKAAANRSREPHTVTASVEYKDGPAEELFL